MCVATVVTHAVVTPNILSPMAVDGASTVIGGCKTIPAIAAAARSMIDRLVELIPAISSKGDIIARTEPATYVRVCPETIVETSILGNPNGSAEVRTLIA